MIIPTSGFKNESLAWFQTTPRLLLWSCFSWSSVVLLQLPLASAFLNSSCTLINNHCVSWGQFQLRAGLLGIKDSEVDSQNLLWVVLCGRAASSRPHKLRLPLGGKMGNGTPGFWICSQVFQVTELSSRLNVHYIGMNKLIKRQSPLFLF